MPFTFDHTFTKFFHYQIPDEILYTHIIKIFHFTLNVFYITLQNLKIITAADFILDLKS